MYNADRMRIQFNSANEFGGDEGSFENSFQLNHNANFSARIKDRFSIVHICSTFYSGMNEVSFQPKYFL